MDKNIKIHNNIVKNWFNTIVLKFGRKYWSTESMAWLLKDFKPGPLDFYRKKASFDWKKLKIVLDSEEVLKYEVSTYHLKDLVISFNHDKNFRFINNIINNC